MPKTKKPRKPGSGKMTVYKWQDDEYRRKTEEAQRANGWRSHKI